MSSRSSVDVVVVVDNTVVGSAVVGVDVVERRCCGPRRRRQRRRYQRRRRRCCRRRRRGGVVLFNIVVVGSAFVDDVDVDAKAIADIFGVVVIDVVIGVTANDVDVGGSSLSTSSCDIVDGIVVTASLFSALSPAAPLSVKSSPLSRPSSTRWSSSRSSSSYVVLGVAVVAVDVVVDNIVDEVDVVVVTWAKESAFQFFFLHCNSVWTRALPFRPREKFRQHRLLSNNRPSRTG